MRWAKIISRISYLFLLFSMLYIDLAGDNKYLQNYISLITILIWVSSGLVLLGISASAAWFLGSPGGGQPQIDKKFRDWQKSTEKHTPLDTVFNLTTIVASGILGYWSLFSASLCFWFMSFIFSVATESAFKEEYIVNEPGDKP